MDEAVARAWFARWELQQDLIIEARSERFDVMLDVLGVLFDADHPLAVLDLASGPGAISLRVLDRFPKARSVAIDIDPVLLAIGRGAHRDLGGRLTWIEHDLRDPAWTDAVRAAAGREHLDAVLSSTALHWIPAGDLVDVYRACAVLLAPGGVLVNCDNMDDASGHNTIRRISDAARNVRLQRQQSDAKTPDFEGWEQWWENVAAAPELAELYEERVRRFAWRDLAEFRPGRAMHTAILEEAGFREVDTVWQRYQNRVLVAIR
jgi:SAM-dependent methyltransferase